MNAVSNPSSFNNEDSLVLRNDCWYQKLNVLNDDEPKPFGHLYREAENSELEIVKFLDAGKVFETCVYRVVKSDKDEFELHLKWGPFGKKMFFPYPSIPLIVFAGNVDSFSRFCFDFRHELLSIDKTKHEYELLQKELCLAQNETLMNENRKNVQTWLSELMKCMNRFIV